MKRISIQGVISGPLPAVFSDYVDDGIVAPVNFFTKALREAEENGEDVEVWINSPGGDVDAGNEMLAAFQSFKGYKCVTVGGMAASMAAYFALQCGARVECHENTRFMFHSARTITEAGPGALRDAADAIDRINAPIKARLSRAAWTKSASRKVSATTARSGWTPRKRLRSASCRRSSRAPRRLSGFPPERPSRRSRLTSPPSRRSSPPPFTNPKTPPQQ